MEIPDYPSNADMGMNTPPVDKDLKRVTTSDPKRRRKPLGKQFSETFVRGDMRSAVGYVVFDVLVPAAQDMIVEAGIAGLQRMIFGDSYRGRRGWRPPAQQQPQSGASGYVQYNRYSMGQPPYQTPPQRAMSRQARARHDFDEIVLTSRVEAEEVLDQMNEVVSRYESGSVADLYELVGLASTHVDHKWGWTSLRGAGIHRVRDGYLLDLPEPIPLG